METPSSAARRVTRSQALAAANSNNNNNNNIPTISRKIEESDQKGVSKSRQRNGKQQQDRSALIDITNDSPIVGLAMGSLETPSSMAKQRNSHTPGSGEALLRGQVKTLLQKVEEEAEHSKLSLEQHRPFLHLQGLVNSPMGLLAPTPANTPHLLNLSGNGSTNNNNNCLASSPIEEQLKISQVVTDIFDGKKQESSLESQKSLITRSLLLDFSEKSEVSDSSECSSVVTYQLGGGGDSEHREKSSTMDDDDASVWSIQVNASTKDEDEEEEEEGDNQREEENDYEEEEEGLLVDELCEGMSKICVNDEKRMAKFIGKHTRFVYNSDDEVVEEECGGESEDYSAGVLRLKGLPTPKGKHLRFPVEDEE